MRFIAFMPDYHPHSQGAFTPDFLSYANRSLDSILASVPRDLKTRRKSFESLMALTHKKPPYENLSQLISFLHQDGYVIALANAKRYNTLGKGAYGRTKWGLLKSPTYPTPQLVVVKIISRTPQQNRPNIDTVNAELETEVAKDYGLAIAGVWKRLSNNDTIEKSYIIMRYAGPALHHYLRKVPDMSGTLRIEFLIKILIEMLRWHSGIAFKSGTPRAHLDLKPDNICLLISDHGRVEITFIDNAFARPIYESKSMICGTPGYLPTDISAVTELQRTMNQEAFQKLVSDNITHNQIDFMMQDLFAIARSSYSATSRKLRLITHTIYSALPPALQALLNTTEVVPYLNYLRGYHQEMNTHHISRKVTASWIAYALGLYSSVPYLAEELTQNRVIDKWQSIEICRSIAHKTLTYFDELELKLDLSIQSKDHIKKARESIETHRNGIREHIRTRPLDADFRPLIHSFHQQIKTIGLDVQCKINAEMEASESQEQNLSLSTESIAFQFISDHQHITIWNGLSSLSRRTLEGIKPAQHSTGFFCCTKPVAPFNEAFKTLQEVYAQTSEEQRKVFFSLDVVAQKMRPYINSLAAHHIYIPQTNQPICWEKVTIINPLSPLR